MIRGHLDRAVIVGDIAWPHVDRVEGRAAGQRLAHDGELEHRAAVRVAGDETEEARIGAGEIGIDREQQHRLHLAPDRLPVAEPPTLSQLDSVGGQAAPPLTMFDHLYRMTSTRLRIGKECVGDYVY